MSVCIQIEPSTGVAIASARGVLGPDDARDSLTQLWEHPQWRGRAAVWDLRAANLDFTPEDVSDVADFVLANQPKAPERVAFVMQRDVDFGMARMFEAFRKRPVTAVRVFRDLEEALRWVEPGRSRLDLA